VENALNTPICSTGDPGHPPQRGVTVPPHPHSQTLGSLSVGVRFWKLTVADPARNERCSRRKKKRGGSRARFKATVRHQVRTVRSPCSRRPATSDGVCNARATRSIAPLPGPGTRVRPRCPRRWEAGCCLLTGHALLFCSPVGDGRGRGRDSWDAPCSTS